MKKRMTRLLITALTVLTIGLAVVPSTNISAATHRCPGCGAAVSQKLTKKTKKQIVVTKKVTKKKIRREYQYKLLNKQYNGNSTAETLYASKNKTVKHTYTVTGSATVEFGYASLGLTNTYTYENSKSTGGGTSKKVPARQYVGFYVGHPMDVFNVDVVKTTKIHCPWCGKLQKTTTKKFCYQAKVPLKTKTLYWKSLTNKKNSFSNVIIEK